MRHYFPLFLSSITIAFILCLPLNAADFNIKLRKTDINQLKEQLMPRFDQSIQYLNVLLSCLEQGKSIDSCLDKHSLIVEGKKSDDPAKVKERNEMIKQNIESKIDEKNIQSEQIISELKKLLAEAETIKSCLQKGQTANDLKDCIVKH